MKVDFGMLGQKLLDEFGFMGQRLSAITWISRPRGWEATTWARKSTNSVLVWR